MPIYEYQCSACGHQFDAFQKLAESPLTNCPNCHKDALTKLISAAGFQLKGSGWYATDYKAKEKPKTAEKQDVSATSEKKSSGSSDSGAASS